MRKVLFAFAGPAVFCVGMAAQGKPAARAQAPATAPKTQADTPKEPPTGVRPMAKLHAAPPDTITTDQQTALVKQYCIDCHSDRGRAGGLTLAAFDARA